MRPTDFFSPKIFLFFILFQLSVCPLLAQTLPAYSPSADSVLSLAEAMRLTLEANPALQLVRQQTQISALDLQYGKAAWLPSLAANANYNSANTNLSQQFNNPALSPIERRGAQNTTLNAGINAVWTVFDGTAMFVAYKQLQVNNQAASMALKMEIQNSLALVCSLWYEVARQQSQLLLFKQNMVLSKQRALLAYNRFSSGIVSKVETLNAQTDLNADSSALQSQLYMCRRSLAALNLQINRSPWAQYRINDTIALGSLAPLATLNQQLEQAMPQLLVARYQSQLALLEQQRLRGLQLPQLDLTSGYNYLNQNSEAGFIKVSQSSALSYGFAARFNIFGRFDQRRQNQQAKLQTQIRKLESEQIRLEGQTRLYDSWLIFQNGLAQLSLQQSDLNIARQNALLSLERYKAGSTTGLEFREAQRKALTAQTRLLETRFSMKMAEIEILRLVGNIANENE